MEDLYSLLLGLWHSAIICLESMIVMEKCRLTVVLMPVIDLIYFHIYTLIYYESIE